MQRAAPRPARQPAVRDPAARVAQRSQRRSHGRDSPTARASTRAPRRARPGAGEQARPRRCPRSRPAAQPASRRHRAEQRGATAREGERRPLHQRAVRQRREQRRLGRSEPSRRRMPRSSVALRDHHRDRGPAVVRQRHVPASDAQGVAAAAHSPRHDQGRPARTRRGAPRRHASRARPERPSTFATASLAANVAASVSGAARRSRSVNSRSPGEGCAAEAPGEALEVDDVDTDPDDHVTLTRR